jgi:uncharacterized protein (TIGR02452 family)
MILKFKLLIQETGNMKNLIEVFEDTKQYTLDNNLIKSKTTKHTFLEIEPAQLLTKSNISVINSDTVSAAIEFSLLGKTALLNMASHKKPGGGVRNGARAQEECLFRCSNLSEVIPISHYPLQEDECLYTSDAVFFKDFNYDYIKPTEIDVITMAAINLNVFELTDFKQYIKTNKDKIRLILSLAIKNGVKNIILGAWGCGVFKNNPAQIATFFKEVLDEGYKSHFDNVVFAIINDHNSVDNNLEIFKSILQ